MCRDSEVNRAQRRGPDAMNPYGHGSPVHPACQKQMYLNRIMNQALSYSVPERFGHRPIGRNLISADGFVTDVRH